MARKFPPRGYKQNEYPLPHNFSYFFQLNAEDTSKDATICTFFRTSESAINADAVQVNPRNAAFVEDTGPLIFNGSIIPRLMVRFSAIMTKGAIETDKLQQINIKYMPLYTAFLPSLDAEDEKTATSVEDTVKLTHATNNKDTHPLFVGKLTTSGNQPLSTVPETEVFGDYGLTTNATMEAVAFLEEEFFDTMQYKTNSGMLKKVVGQFKTQRLTQERGFTFFSNNFTKPMVKRGNPYTFCGMLFVVPAASEMTQLFPIGASTTIPHVVFKVSVRFDEWNPNFDQNAY